MSLVPHDRRQQPAESDIQRAAYFLWLKEGRPEGRALENWCAAKERLRNRRSEARRKVPRRPPASARRAPFAELTDSQS